MSNLLQDSCGCAVHQTHPLCKISVISRLSHKFQIVLQKQPMNHINTNTGTDCCWDVHSCLYLSIVLELPAECSRCSPGITAHQKLSLFDCWGLMEVACKKHNLCITCGACKGRRHVGIYGSVLLSPGFHIFGGDCAEVHGLYCRVMVGIQKCLLQSCVVICCFVSAGPQTDIKSTQQLQQDLTHPNIQWKYNCLH